MVQIQFSIHRLFKIENWEVTLTIDICYIMSTGYFTWITIIKETMQFKLQDTHL